MGKINRQSQSRNLISFYFCSTSRSLEPLSRSAFDDPPSRSILWIWLQRFGTLALHTPIDSRTEIVLSAARERAPPQRFYHFGNSSVYFRQGNEFGDAESVITSDFAKESHARRVEVLLHEDLHDDKNFDLVWEYEESLVNPLGILAALDHFEAKGDQENFDRIVALYDKMGGFTPLIEELKQLNKKLPDLKVSRRARNDGLFESYFEVIDSYLGELEKTCGDSAR